MTANIYLVMYTTRTILYHYNVSKKFKIIDKQTSFNLEKCIINRVFFYKSGCFVF